MQRKHDLIFGYINAIQILLPTHSSYYNITLHLKNICAGYIYWYNNDTDSVIYKQNDKFLHPYIIKQNEILQNDILSPAFNELIRLSLARFKHLVDRGFLAPQFLKRMQQDGLIKFIKQNHTLIGNQLTKLLSVRKSKKTLIESRIIDPSYNHMQLHDTQSTPIQRKHDLIFGYIDTIQILLPTHSSYYNIPLHLKNMCARYIYWYNNDIDDEKFNPNNKYIHPYIITQNEILQNDTLSPAHKQLIYIFLGRFKYLVNRGLCPLQILERMEADRNEIVKFYKTNVCVVTDTIERRLSKRPSKHELIERGILVADHSFKHNNMQVYNCESRSLVPIVYDMDHDINTSSINTNKMITVKVLQKLLSERTTIQRLVINGIVDVETINKYYYELDKHSVNNIIRHELSYSELLLDILKNNDNTINVVVYKHDSCIQSLQDTVTKALEHSDELNRLHEQDMLIDMENVNVEMRTLRSSLDVHFVNDTVWTQQEEDIAKKRFKEIEDRLRKISKRQNLINEKLTKIHSAWNTFLDFEDRWFRLLKHWHQHQTMINYDLHRLENMNCKKMSDTDNINDGIKELKLLKSQTNDTICALRIGILKTSFESHMINGIVMAMKTNEEEINENDIKLTYEAAYFLVIIIYDLNGKYGYIPHEIKHVIAKYTVYPNGWGILH